MTGPGEYMADVTEGITRVEDLPEPRIVRRQRSFKRRKCPRCGHSSYRDKVFTRRLHDLGDLAADRPIGPGGHLLPALLFPLPQVLQC